MTTNNDDPMEQRLSTLETRLARLEGRRPPAALPGLAQHPAWPLASGFVSLACGVMGMGLPQHHYQFLFAALMLVVVYHRGAIKAYSGGWRWPLIVINYFLFALVLKLLIGGGTSYPLQWVKVPALKSVPKQGDESWFSRVVPDYQLHWEGVTSVSDLSLDITRIQTVLLIVTLIGALLRFQPFASLTALAMLAISLPSFFGYHWDWLILFMVFSGTTVYLQTTRAAHSAIDNGA